jgi:hypothetical protein
MEYAPRRGGTFSVLGHDGQYIKKQERCCCHPDGEPAICQLLCLCRRADGGEWGEGRTKAAHRTSAKTRRPSGNEAAFEGILKGEGILAGADMRFMVLRQPSM